MDSDTSRHELPQLPRPGDTLEERYRLKKVFASGGMGVIMRAQQLRTGRDVAVKILHPHIAAEEDFAARFKREVRVATLFDHPSIVRVYDVGETDAGLLYLVMELLEGRELKEIIQTCAPLRANRVLDIGAQFLDGLAEAHSQEVVHRDLKPANLFIGRDRRDNDDVKILDFGIAKLINSQETQLTETGKITGTPSYMAPEVLIGEDFASRKPIDVYGSGLILLEMLTGQQVFDADTMAQTLIKQMKKPVPIPDVVAETPLGKVIERSTAKHPADRYPDAEAMLEDFKAARRGTPDSLRLDSDEIPGPAPETSPSLLDKMTEQGDETNLEMLRNVPQHVEFSSDGDEQSSRQSPDGSPRSVDDAGVGDRDIGAPPDSPPDYGSRPGRGRNWRRIALIGATIGLAIFVAVGLFFFFTGQDSAGDSEPMADQRNTDADSTAPGDSDATGETEDTSGEGADEADKTVSVHLRSEPNEALVWQDNQVLGRTEVTLDFERENLPRVLRFEKEGYRDRDVEIAATEDVTLDIELEPREDEPVAARESPGDSGEPATGAEPVDEPIDDPDLPTVRNRDSGESDSGDRRVEQPARPHGEASDEEAPDREPPDEETTAEKATAEDSTDEDSTDEDSTDDTVARYLGDGDDGDSDDESDRDGTDPPDSDDEAEESNSSESTSTDDLVDQHL